MGASGAGRAMNEGIGVALHGEASHMTGTHQGPGRYDYRGTPFEKALQLKGVMSISRSTHANIGGKTTVFQG